MEKERRFLPEGVYHYDELLKLFADFHIDSDKIRFYVDRAYDGPKAFVIYKEGDDYVVYKMKADGSRAVRYEGPDESYAVNEFYQKFLEEVKKRPAFARKLLPRDEYPTTRSTRRRSGNKTAIIAIIATFALSGLAVFGAFSYNRYKHRHDGYYVTDNGSYYRRGDDFYYYDNSWIYYGSYNDFYDYYDDYEYYDYYHYNDEYSDFRDSDYYYDSDDDDYDYDDDSGWSSDDSWDSWDSDSSDWDSDW